MKPYRTNLREVPEVAGLSPHDGWINMEVQFLIDQKSVGSDLVWGWSGAGSLEAAGYEIPPEGYRIT